MLLLMWWWDSAALHTATANWAPLLAQAAPLDPSLFERYGPGGLIALIALTLLWMERKERIELQTELRELNKLTREQTVPALTQATAAVTEAMRVLRKDQR